MIIRVSSQNSEKNYMPGYSEEERSSCCFLCPLIVVYMTDKRGLIFRIDNISIKRKTAHFLYDVFK